MKTSLRLQRRDHDNVSDRLVVNPKPKEWNTPKSLPPIHGHDFSHVNLFAHDPGPRSYPQIQPKLTVGAPNDKYEQEADRVAQQVMAMPDAKSAVQRDMAPEQDEALQTKPLAATITPVVQMDAVPDEEQAVQGKFLQRDAVPDEEQAIQGKSALPAQGSLQTQGNLEGQLNSSKGGGSPLPDEVRSFMEPRFGADFSGVRVHTDGEAIQMNRELGAQAFTHGNHIYYGAGKAPNTDELTGHELTHVVQQNQAIQTKGLTTSQAGFLQKGNPGVTSQELTPVMQPRVLTKADRQVQRKLSKDDPINSAEVGSITHLTNLIWLLDGANPALGKVVVKWETRSQADPTLEQFEARNESGNELARAMLDTNIDKRKLTANDVTQLQQAANGMAATPGAARLLRHLALAMANPNDLIAVKMEALGIGRNLGDLSNDHAAAPGGPATSHITKMFTSAKCRQYGQMAFFDVLTRNRDRFKSDGTANRWNIDYDASYANAIALDNLHVASSLVDANWGQNLAEMDAVKPANWDTYATQVIASLVQHSGMPATTWNSMQMATAKTMFIKGMEQSFSKAAGVISRWEQGHKGTTVNRVRGNAAASAMFDTQKVLIARYKRCCN